MIIASDTWADFAGSLWDDPTTRWIVYASLVAGLGVAGWRVWRKVRPALDAITSDLAVVKHEVKNNHTTNLREEADVRHDENRALLASIDQKVDGILGVLGQHGYRLDELEDEVSNTHPRVRDQSGFSPD